jgi:RHS repeat-associated protein
VTNARGLTQRVTDESGVTRHFVYDNLDRIVALNGGDSGIPAIGHLSIGYERRDTLTGNVLYNGTTPIQGLEPTRITDQNGHDQLWAYDALGRLALHRDNASNMTRYSWCCTDGLASIVDANNQTTTWTRTRLDGLPNGMQRADGSTESYLYDLLGRLKQVTDGNNIETLIAYTHDSQIASVSAGDLTNWYAYDHRFPRLTEAGRVGTGPFPLWLTDAVFQYNPDGSLRSEHAPATTSTVYRRYDTLGRTRERAIGLTGSLHRTTLDFDTFDRLTAMGGSQGTTSVRYLPSSPTVIEGLDHPNSTSTTLTRDGTIADRRITGASRTVVGSTTPFQWSVGYTNPGRLQWEWVDTRYTYYSYHPSGFLYQGDSQVLRNGQWQLSDLERYQYDPTGNRTLLDTWWDHETWWSGEHRVTTHWADLLYYASWPDWPGTPDLDYQHDFAGNLTWDGTNFYSWDAFGRVESISHAVAGTWHTSTFTYDALNRVSSINDNGSIRRLVWDGDTLLEERNAASGAVLRRLFSDGFEQGGNRYYYVRDVRGSVVALTGSDGTLRKRWSYSVWGIPTTRWSAPGAESLQSPIGFAGYRVHEPTGLNLTQARVYNPNLGRWLSRDPLGFRNAVDGRHLYAYVANDPINFNDPSGTVVSPVMVGAIGGAIYGAVSTGISQMNSGHYSLRGLVAGTATGAFMGALGVGMLFTFPSSMASLGYGIPVTPAGWFLMGMISGNASYMANQVATGQCITPNGMFFAMIGGGISGLASGPSSATIRAATSIPVIMSNIGASSFGSGVAVALQRWLWPEAQQATATPVSPLTLTGP